MEGNLPETLKPFFHRATEAQERLAKLEAALASTKIDIPEAKIVEETTQIQSKLDEAKAKLEEEQKKVKELTIKNEKQENRILHLIRALRAADESLRNSQNDFDSSSLIVGAFFLNVLTKRK